MQASVPEFPQRASIREDRAPPPYIGAVPATLAARVFAYLIDLIAIACIIFVLVLALAVLAFPSLGLSLIAIWPVLVATPILYSGLTPQCEDSRQNPSRIFCQGLWSSAYPCVEASPPSSAYSRVRAYVQ